MPDNKIHIRPKSQNNSYHSNKPYNRPPQRPRRNFNHELDDLARDLKSLDIELEHLEKEKQTVDKLINHKIILELINGQERKGVLKEIDKFTIDLQEGDVTKTYMKHAILGYYPE